jgi:gamma-glutamylcyclotransferase (GGCT)/AIG2-like uncharacterized protein YtfP
LGVTEVTAHLFAYGTLICEDIMVAVSGRRVTGVRCWLRDYARGKIQGEVYPGIVARPGKVVEGVLYSDLPEAAWKRLDLFEGERYQRKAIQVELEDGDVREAQVYVLRPEFAHALSASPWSLEEFLRSGKEEFRRRYLGFEALKKDH